MPKGYLRVLVFNKDSALVPNQPAPVQLTQAANGGYERLSLQLVLPQDGYVSAYVGNESDVDVLFDDVSVEHRPGLLVQETQYDPAGLELAGLVLPSPGIRGLNNYRFNGKEFQADLGLNWNHQDWRFLDSQLLRWHSVDRLAEKETYSSPYVFVNDNPINKFDSNGQSGIASIDQKNHTVTISSRMIFYGPSANAQVAKNSAADVQNAWNAARGKVTMNGVVYTVKFSVTGVFKQDLSVHEVESNKNYENNYIKVQETNILQKPISNISSMDESGNSATFLTRNIKADGSTTEAHEMGHGWGENHSPTDIRGQGTPGIMSPRGTFVDAAYQYNPNAEAGNPGGTMNPESRKVNQVDINNLGLQKLNYNSSGKANIGKLTNYYNQISF